MRALERHVTIRMKVKRRTIDKNNGDQAIVAGVENIAFVNSIANRGGRCSRANPGDRDRA
jgi:hypothetical protein